MLDNSPTIRAATATDTGRVRQQNEDACLYSPEQGLFIVSDGMGGHQAGATAANIVVRVLPALIGHRHSAEVPENKGISGQIVRAVTQLNTLLRQESEKHAGLRGMGATLVMVRIVGRRAYITHLGDSRAYLDRKRRLRQLTEDHNIAAALFRLGEITRKELRDHPTRHQLSQYVGMDQDPLLKVRKLDLQAGDRLLLCSDGLSGMISNRRVARILRKQSAPESACNALVEAANAAGGRDNISVIVIDIIEWTERSELEESEERPKPPR